MRLGGRCLNLRIPFGFPLLLVLLWPQCEGKAKKKSYLVNRISGRIIWGYSCLFSGIFVCPVRRGANCLTVGFEKHSIGVGFLTLRGKAGNQLTQVTEKARDADH
jgi:hypothetical protein